MSDLDLPELIGGKYRPLRLIGKGGMGAVYEVEHTHTGQHLALKVLARQQGDGSAERFKREARAASSIQSEHIVRVTDADVAPELAGAPFLVMELLEGEDLDRVIERGPVPAEESLVWLRQVARGLDRAHARGIVHRDLKPANLFLTQRDDGSPLVKILDFGIAKMDAHTALTRSDAFLGTPGFMAPEQTDSRGAPVTFRADLYALGLVSFKLLVGRNYWRDGNLAQLLAQSLVEAMPPPSERGSSLGPEFDRWFLRACSRDPLERFESAHEQVEALAAALGLPQQPRHASGPSPRHVAEALAPRPEQRVVDATPPAVSRRPERSTPPGNTLHALVRIIGGTGLAALALGGGFGVASLVSYHDATTLCPTRNECNADALSARNSAETRAWVSNVALGLGVVGVGVGVGGWLLLGGRSRRGRGAKSLEQTF